MRSHGVARLGVTTLLLDSVRTDGGLHCDRLQVTRPDDVRLVARR